MRINLTDIYAKMRGWYDVLVVSHGQEDSYNKLYSALFTLYCANLISHDDWKKITEYDKKLFDEYDKKLFDGINN